MSETASQSQAPSPSPSQSRQQPRRFPWPAVQAGVSMRELLAAGTAAVAVSTPPSVPEPARHRPPQEHPAAA